MRLIRFLKNIGEGLLTFLFVLVVAAIFAGFIGAVFYWVGAVIPSDPQVQDAADRVALGGFVVMSLVLVAPLVVWPLQWVWKCWKKSGTP